ncbi:MAG: rhodanese-like domain-containing protein [Desulfobacterales bacterium]|nr:rhodanese-like domain-containing protein [Desulfobacterales bacterium]
MMKWLQFITPVKSMDYEQTQTYITDHPAEDITILDVRQPSEYEQGHIPGARLIPLPQLSDRLSEINPVKPIFVY